MDEDTETDENEAGENNTDEIKPEVQSLTNDGNAIISKDDDAAITNATKNLLSSICMVFCLFFDEKYNSDYHVSLERVMQQKRFEHGDGAVSIL